MATPPFNINQSSPGDSDIVSQYPLNERTTRDIIESWLLIDHNNMGQHAKLTMPWGAAPSAPGASLTIFYVDTDGVFHSVDATYDRIIGVPPGVVNFTAGSTVDAGYLLADGSAVSRTVFARLFAKIGVTHGAGDGSTTFNLPKINGRVIAGEDDGTTLNSTYFGTAPVLGAVGGVDNTVIAKANLPSYNLDVSIPSGQGVHVHGYAAAVNNATTPGGGFATATAVSTNTGSNGIPAHTGTAATGGSGTAISRVQPTIILKAQIKF